MRCEHCGRTDSLVETTFRDEDGVLYTDWLDLCVFCEEIEIERSEARREWNAYHDEPCPEIELPQFLSARQGDA
jgi:hypothetical protein